MWTLELIDDNDDTLVAGEEVADEATAILRAKFLADGAYNHRVRVLDPDGVQVAVVIYGWRNGVDSHVYR